METTTDASLRLNTFSFVTPTPNGWKLYFYGYKTSPNIILHLYDKSKPPCRFHRLMQKLCFGFIWVKEDE